MLLKEEKTEIIEKNRTTRTIPVLRKCRSPF